MLVGPLAKIKRLRVRKVSTNWRRVEVPCEVRSNDREYIEWLRDSRWRTQNVYLVCKGNRRSEGPGRTEKDIKM